MKAYTDYIPEKCGSQKGCVLVAEDAFEIIMIKAALEKELESTKQLLSSAESLKDTGVTLFKNRVIFLEKLISELEPQNSIPLKRFTEKISNRDFTDLHCKK